MRVLKDVRRKLMDEVENMSKRDLNANTIHIIYEVMDAIKDTYEIEGMEGGEYSHGRMSYGYSEEGGVERGRGVSYRRDSMGRYSRDGGMGGSSYGGSSMDEYIEMMMEEAKTREQREAIERFRRELAK